MPLACALRHQGWPTFDDNNVYQGPLPSWCGHKHGKSLLSKRVDGKLTFPTAAAAAYPPNLCEWIARVTFAAARLHSMRSQGQHAQATVPRNLLPVEEWESSEDDELHEPKPRLGDGNVGTGTPIRTAWGGKSEHFHDGAGLCSPGRWWPEKRSTPPVAAQKVKDSLIQIIRRRFPAIGQLALKLAANASEESPFSDSMIKEGVEAILTALAIDPVHHDKLREIPDHQPFRLYLLATIARSFNDPDWKVVATYRDSFATGVPVGTDGLPRTPAVYERKRTWRKLVESDFDPWRDNYRSIDGHEDILEQQLREERALGMCFTLPLEEAKRRWPGNSLRIASIGALSKGDDSFRILHDGTRGVRVNNESRMRDRIRMPGPKEEKAILRRAAGKPHLQYFCLQADVSKAHRRFLHRPRDWGLLAFRIREGDDIWLNRVGTFGIGSAGYWWGRLAGIISRCALSMTGSSEFFYLIFADDIKMSAAGPEKFELLIMVLFFWALLGCPFSWRKTRGGMRTEWIGFAIDYTRFEMGLSEKRAAWIIRWLTDLLAAGRAPVQQVVEGLGRLGFASGVLEFHRPFLAPLYSWTSAVPPKATLRLPVAIQLTLSHVLRRFQKGERMYRCLPISPVRLELFRTDASATDDHAVLGGWETSTTQDPRSARWFALKITKCELPEFFKGDTAMRTVAAWELLATILAFHVFSTPPDGRERNAVSFIGGATDNQGNPYAVNRLMSTKFPLNVLVMQLAVSLEESQTWLDLQWIPREDNALADALTNLDFSSFTPANRVEARVDAATFPTLFEMLAEARNLFNALEISKQGGPKPRIWPRTAKDKKLKVADPW